MCVCLGIIIINYYKSLYYLFTFRLNNTVRSAASNDGTRVRKKNCYKQKLLQREVSQQRAVKSKKSRQLLPKENPSATTSLGRILLREGQSVQLRNVKVYLFCRLESIWHPRREVVRAFSRQKTKQKV